MYKRNKGRHTRQAERSQESGSRVREGGYPHKDTARARERIDRATEGTKGLEEEEEEEEKEKGKEEEEDDRRE